MKIFLVIICLSMASLWSVAQSEEEMTLPYHQIPEYQDSYGPGNIVSRLIDGLGYRYYWATEGLREEDLNYLPSEDSRSTHETLKHINGLSKTILNGSTNTANIRPAEIYEVGFDELRKATLENFQHASLALIAKSEEEISELMIVFQRGENKNEFPFWHLINGPISDAIYHTGQIVSNRRASGNPLNPTVNLFSGKTGQ